jgi:hypothetical protein
MLVRQFAAETIRYKHRCRPLQGGTRYARGFHPLILVFILPADHRQLFHGLLHLPIGARSLFKDVRVGRYLWAVDYTADTYIDLLNTYSDHLAMDESKRDVLYAEIRKRISARPSRKIRKHYLSLLHIARLRR